MKPFVKAEFSMSPFNELTLDFQIKDMVRKKLTQLKKNCLIIKLSSHEARYQLPRVHTLRGHP